MNEEIVKIKYCFQIYKYLKEVCSGLLKIYAPEFKKMETSTDCSFVFSKICQKY